jgi:integrase
LAIMVSTALQLFDDAGSAAVGVVDEPASRAVLEQRARACGAEAQAANGRRGYRSDLRHFGAWCASRGLVALPAAPETVRLYLVDHAGRLAISTLRRRLAAICEAHVAAGEQNPTTSPLVTCAWAGMRHSQGSAPRATKATVPEDVTAMVAGLGWSLSDLRDRALLLVGLAGALRHGELSALDVGDVAATGDGLLVTVRRSTEREGEGAVVGLAYGSDRRTCPVRAWRAWVQAARLVDGPAFRTLRNGTVTAERLTAAGITRMIQRRAQAAGLDPALFTGPWLRSGLAPTAAGNGAPGHKIMRPGR